MSSPIVTNKVKPIKMRRFITAILLFVSLVAFAQPGHKFNASYPDVHDPVMAQGEDGRYYIFSTGIGISVMSSTDMKTWRQEKSIFTVKQKFHDGTEMIFEGNTPLPSWTTDSIRGFHGHIWAPDISYHPSTGSGQDGKWYLYYSCSTFGKNGSAIGLATNKTLDPTSPDYKWEDQGPVIVSHKNIDNYNCIDPNLSVSLPLGEGRGEAFLFFGSFWDGIQILPLNEDYKTPSAKSTTIARRYAPAKNAKFPDPESFTIEGKDTIEAGENAIEAPFVIKRGDWYYLFVSWDYCCRGKNSTYKTVYGRSRSLTGPYLDNEGKDMAQGGGTLLVGPNDEFYGIGHCSAYQFGKQWYFIAHAYDISQKGQSKLFIRKMEFTKDGWIKLKK